MRNDTNFGTPYKEKLSQDIVGKDRKKGVWVVQVSRYEMIQDCKIPVKILHRRKTCLCSTSSIMTFLAYSILGVIAIDAFILCNRNKAFTLANSRY